MTTHELETKELTHIRHLLMQLASAFQGLERTLYSKEQAERREHNQPDMPPPEHLTAPLSDAFQRTFTGTYVGRKMFQEQNEEKQNGETDKGPPKPG